MESRVYVCHTFYNVYVSLLKELNYQKDNDTIGTILLSNISADFKDLKYRLEKSGIFKEVVELNEVHPSKFNVKFRYENIKGKWNPLRTYANWFLQWKFIAKQTTKHISVDFSKYDEIFVFCDSDPIGMYLNYHKIKYIAVEDGLESIRLTKIELETKFLLLKILLAKLGLVFLKDGYSKYAKAVEVDNLNNIYSFGRKLIANSRASLLENLSNSDKEKIYNVFFTNKSLHKFNNTNKNAMLLAGKLCSSKKSFDIYRDIIRDHLSGYNIYIKPHPNDESDYENEFKDCIVLERFFPVEIFNIKCDFDIEKLVSVTSVLDQHNFAKEKLRLGINFLDNYDDPEMLYQPK